MRIPDGMYGKIETRSSFAAKGLQVLGGIIDCDYRGFVKICLINHSDSAFTINVGDKIGQIIYLKYRKLDHVILQGNEDILQRMYPTERSENGFGSTDIRK